MSRLMVDDITKTDARALINVNKMALISDFVAPNDYYLQATHTNELTIMAGCVITVGDAGIFKTTNTTLTAANLDVGSTFTIGNDYYVYICDHRNDAVDEQYIISLNATYPSGWNQSNSRKIGGFHYGWCRKVNSNLQPINNDNVIFGEGWESAVTNGILPRSVWTLKHRPKCNPEGMVYLGSNTWVDIYLSSDDGAMGLKSTYNSIPLTGSEGLNWYNFVERLSKSDKRMPDYAEFCAYAFGSPQGLDESNTNAWTATTNTKKDHTGNVINAVSAIGCMDAVGRTCEWTNELTTRAEPHTNTNHTKIEWGWDINNTLKSGEKDYNVGNIYQYYAESLVALSVGGHWWNGSVAGSRSVYCYYPPWYIASGIGVRGVCDAI